VDEVTLQYGGVVIRFRRAAAGVILRVPPQHRPYIVDAARRVDHEVTCEFGPITPLDAPVVYRPAGDPRDRWLIRRAADGTEESAYLAPAPGGGTRPVVALRMDAALTRTRYQFDPVRGEPGVVPIDHPADEFIAARLLGARGDVVLHACALVDDEGAYLFTGHSGAGKSTIAGIGLAAGSAVLSDDRTIVTIRDGIAYASGTPWQGSGRPGLPLLAPVRGIFLLVQARENRASAMSGARAVGELYVRTIQPTTQPRELLRVVETLERLVERVRVAELRFSATREAYVVAREFVSRAG
jgi:hypothetical protein